ncbi:MAG: O-succinylhomoserine sulfhydrylase [Burkholderiales bacterium 35-55-47]|jgi:O-succinylhomoserine sulfhydrylase|uniref:O-succinylhomoserine sulfhydrylase n=1 Tax=Limnohabitans sp. TaxID=1907725 RepID=UPI000BD638FE|nr:O-succinylhomoserine sulfhydrylase [Limnohabitans sp.]OYY19999.1 MAG: O-succinylhomoserine sulfhydrylase [Burkholderiales bacterium 35-55-47]OYZ74391.1 MAG: O-succinylhomoserine sulfhydrylase [Burkholderiales bacterium 24-55-52]OZB01718.1 MAG: O-succinylhomoserine sulfhydrylase [Burkholderiales bacterium 39-55-53]HQR86220.1 O-succinylhomoserine sulfhydrylase [Limnohabitans sp.]HQS25863.1 O-succinylhomoserine sulfhydrylase [Limnohabitans sp.]
MSQHPLPTDLHLETLAVRLAADRSQYGENSEALYLTSGYVQPSAEASARRFAGEEDGYTYGRSGNPTVSSFEMRLAALEGSEAALATSSGMSSVMLMLFSLLKAGDHVVYSQSMFGSTLKLIGSEFARFGVESTVVSQTDLAAWQAAIRPNTKLLFAETPTNPLTEVCDIAALAYMAHNAGALLAVDNCFATPILQRPMAMGADIVMHSGTKYLDGQGRVMAGALCASEKLIKEKLLPVMKNSGMVLSPFNAWVVLKGLETLDIRMRAQSAHAHAMAQWLEQHPAVSRVYYPGLASHPQHDLALKQMSGMGGAVLSFDVKAADPQQARTRAFHVLDSLRTLSLCTNLGDTKTLLTHPASTSHGKLSEDQRQAAGIGQGMIRLAAGLEHLDDMKADLLRGLDTL